VDLDNFDLSIGSASPSPSPKKRTKAKSKGSRSNSRRKPPSKANRKQTPDDCRPDSDQQRFASLHQAKQDHRLSKKKMAKSTVSPAGTDDDEQSTVVGDNNPAVNDGLSGRIPRKKSAQGGNDNAEHAKTNLSLEDYPPYVRERFIQEWEVWERKDSKLASAKLRPALAKARKTNLHLKFNNELLHEYKDEADKLRKENVDLRKQLHAKVSRNKAMVLRESEGEKENILKVVNGELWRVAKFINCKEDQEQCDIFVYKALYPNLPFDDDKAYGWMMTYTKVIRDGLYAKRNYVASRMKECAWRFFTNGQTPPTVEMIRKCIAREIDVNHPEEMAVFKWFWETLLPKVVGAKEWGPSVHLYNCISTYKIPNDHPKNRGLITPSDEGIIATLWENQHDKWHELWTWSRIPANDGKKQVNRGGKWTSSNTGQCDFSGWDPAGIEAYNAYCGIAAAGRTGANRKLLEKTTLQQLRLQYNIVQPDHDAQRAANRRRRRGNEQPPVAAQRRRIVRAMNMWDEDYLGPGEDE
jgi:hypothetical protein